MKLILGLLQASEGRVQVLGRDPRTTDVRRHSPSIEVLRWVQRAFPVIKSPGVQDSHPLMKPPTRGVTEEPMNTTQRPHS